MKGALQGLSEEGTPKKGFALQAPCLPHLLATETLSGIALGLGFFTASMMSGRSKSLMVFVPSLLLFLELHSLGVETFASFLSFFARFLPDFVNSSSSCSLRLLLGVPLGFLASCFSADL